jgi:membrane protease YdiL (CAAX protease family)
MQAKPESKLCGNCSVMLPPNAEFCGKCGNPVNGLPIFYSLERRVGIPERVSNWHEMRALMGLYSGLLVASLIFGLSSRFERDPTIEIVYWALVISGSLIFLALKWQISRDAFSLKPCTAQTLFEVLFATGVTYVALEGYFYVIQNLGVGIVRVTEAYSTAGWPVWSFFVMCALLPGIFEEIIFRGVMQTNLERIISKSEALVVQAALFSILHLLPSMFISHFVFGLLMGWIRNRLGHLYLCCILHIGWNSAVVIAEV